MAARKRGKPTPPPVTGVLDWRSSAHWAAEERPCRYCQIGTHLRDSARKPAHKTCAEEALRRQAAEAAAAYQNARLP